MESTNYTERNSQKEPTDAGLNLKPYSVIEGSVVYVDQPGGAIHVRTKGSLQPVPCVYCGGFMSSMMGFNTTFAPTPGTGVVVFWPGTRPGFILGCIPKVSKIPQGQNNRAVGGESFADSEQSKATHQGTEAVFNNHQGPVDILEGEIDLRNAAGVGMTFLRHLSMLSGGALAKVECHLLDDMVRILSDKFKHHHAFGDHEIFNDRGKLNLIYRGGSRDYELLGKEGKQEDRKAETDQPNDIDVEKEVKDKWREAGRYRFHQYVGYIGNFINTFVTDPMGHLADAAESQFSSGNFRYHVHEDGSFLLQSVGDIIIERRHKIPVPIEVKRYDDPEREIDETIGKEPLKTWVARDETKLFEIAYQLRDHGAWFSNLYSLASFHMEDTYKVPEDSEIVQGDKDQQNPDRRETNSEYNKERHVLYLNKYATFRILRDGSIVCHDASGSAINMSNRDVTISASRNLNLEAANHVVIDAGNDIILKARRHIDGHAAQGGIMFRAKSWWQALCDEGTLVIEGKASDSGGDSEIEPRIIEDVAVLIKSSKKGTLMSSSGDISLVTTAGAIKAKCLNFLISVSKALKVNTNFEVTASGLTAGGTTTLEQLQCTGLRPWAYTTPNGTPAPIFLNPLDPATPIAVQLKLKGLRATLNTAQQLKAPTEGFKHQESYEGVTEYESLTQQFLKVEETEGYEDVEQTGSAGGVGKPYPGGADILAYVPENQAKLGEDLKIPNKDLSNKPKAFTTARPNKYFKP